MVVLTTTFERSKTAAFLMLRTVVNRTVIFPLSFGQVKAGLEELQISFLSTVWDVMFWLGLKMVSC